MHDDSSITRAASWELSLRQSGGRTKLPRACRAADARRSVLQPFAAATCSARPLLSALLLPLLLPCALATLPLVLVLLPFVLLFLGSWFVAALAARVSERSVGPPLDAAGLLLAASSPSIASSASFELLIVAKLGS